MNKKSNENSPNNEEQMNSRSTNNSKKKRKRNFNNRKIKSASASNSNSNLRSSSCGNLKNNSSSGENKRLSNQDENNEYENGESQENSFENITEGSWENDQEDADDESESDATESSTRSSERDDIEFADEEICGEKARFYFKFEIQEYSKRMDKYIMILGEMNGKDSLVELRKLDRISTDLGVEEYLNKLEWDIEREKRDSTLNDEPNIMRIVLLRHLKIANICKSSTNLRDFFNYLLALTYLCNSNSLWLANLTDTDQKKRVQIIMECFFEFWELIMKNDLSIFGVDSCGLNKPASESISIYLKRFSRRVSEYCTFKWFPL